jgi:hypothetical protein
VASTGGTPRTLPPIDRVPRDLQHLGQALAFVPVIARSIYGIALDREIILIVAAVLFLLLPTLVITRIARGPEGL